MSVRQSFRIGNPCDIVCIHADDRVSGQLFHVYIIPFKPLNNIFPCLRDDIGWGFFHNLKRFIIFVIGNDTCVGLIPVVVKPFPSCQLTGLHLTFISLEAYGLMACRVQDPLCNKPGLPAGFFICFFPDISYGCCMIMGKYQQVHHEMINRPDLVGEWFIGMNFTQESDRVEQGCITCWVPRKIIVGIYSLFGRLNEVVHVGDHLIRCSGHQVV